MRTVDNFGTTGEAPSHPELLAYIRDARRRLTDEFGYGPTENPVHMHDLHALGLDQRVPYPIDPYHRRQCERKPNLSTLARYQH